MFTFLRKIKSFIVYQKILYSQINDIHSAYFDDLKSVRLNLGQMQAQLNNQKESINSLSEVEFQIFSQWGDDGIIQYLINKIQIPNCTFIEFGVENYRESNTRFLLINNNWSGYIIDGSQKNIDFINNDAITWACELHTRTAFITRENINELLLVPTFKKEVGILSIDIDGNDYWIWDAVTVIEPIIVICEYNALFGMNKAWTVPYDPAFNKYQKHFSIIYYGASLKALCFLGEKKGYQFIGCNSKGNNAYFIKKVKMVDAIKPKSCEGGYIVSKFREAGKKGARPIGKERIKLLDGMEILDVESNVLTKIDSATIQYNL